MNADETIDRTFQQGSKEIPSLEDTNFEIRDGPDSWEFCERLGAGAMGAVYRGYRIGGLTKEVALKVSLRNQRACLKQEAQLVAQLQPHSHITNVYDYDDADNYGIIEMEYIQGKDLSEIVEKHTRLGLRVPQKLAGLIGWTCCEALNSAHTAEVRDIQGKAVIGIIHRDIKPNNIMIRMREGIPVIIDLGTGILSTDTPQIIGQMSGTLGYIAPEILKEQQIDQRVDIYSLGMVMHYLIRGRNPVLTEEITKTKNPLEMIHRVISLLDRGIPPLTELPNIDSEFSEIVRKATSLNQDKRYNTAEEMQKALNAYLYQKGYYGPTRHELKLYSEIINSPELPPYLRKIRRNAATLPPDQLKNQIQHAKTPMQAYMVKDDHFCLETLAEPGYIAID